MKSFIYLTCLTTTLVLSVATATSNAQVKNWNHNGNGDWTDAANWSPFGVPGPANIARNGFLPGTENTVITIENDQIFGGLELIGGTKVYVNSGSVDVDDILLSGPGNTELLLQSQSIALTTGNLTVEEEATFRIANDASTFIENTLNIDAGGVVEARGTFEFQKNSGIALRNSGVIDSSPGLGGLVLNQAGDATLDLDGISGTGVVNVTGGNGFFGQDQLTVNGTSLSDPFSGTINLRTASILAMNLIDGWTADAESQINIESSSSNADGVTRIQGGALTIAGDVNLLNGHDASGDLVLIEAPAVIASSANFTLGSGNELEFASTTIEGGTFQLEQFANVTFTGGTVVYAGDFNTFSNLSAQGAVVFDGPTVWDGNVTADGVLRQRGTATVNGLTFIDATILDMDGGGDTNWFLNHILSVTTTSVGSSISNNFHGTFHINNPISRLSVDLVGPIARWKMAGTMNLTNELPGPAVRLSGSPVDFTGELNLLGGAIRIDADASFENSSLIDFATADVRLVLDRESEIAPGASFQGNGDLVVGSSGRLNLNDGVSLNNMRLENQGILDIGHPTGIATVNELEMNSDALWLVDISGDIVANEHDVLLVNETATLGGTLGVKLSGAGDGSFAPAIGDQFTILIATGGIVGQFDNSPVSIFNGTAYQWDVQYNSNDVTIQLVGTTASVFLGDVNVDGAVNLLDVAPFVDLLTTGSYMLQADINCDGQVDLLDVAPFVELIISG